MFGRVYLSLNIVISFIILIAFIAQTLVDIPITHAQPAIHAQSAGHANLPQGCIDDGKADYPGAINCILNPNAYSCTIDPQFPGQCSYNCKVVPLIDNNCTYTPADRPHDTPVKFVAIHDSEGSLQDDLKVFQNPTS